MPSYLVFDVRLLGVPNPPWRRIMLRSTLSFQALHVAIQDACGWEDNHLHLFRDVDDPSAQVCGSPFFEEKTSPNTSRVKLRSVFKQPGDVLLYEYDFGDGWEHEVKLIEIFEDRATFERRLIGGEQAFPPEDCGGIPGYLECIRVTTGSISLEVGAVPNPNATPQGDEELRDWLGSWTPTRFHLRIAMKNFER